MDGGTHYLCANANLCFIDFLNYSRRGHYWIVVRAVRAMHGICLYPAHSHLGHFFAGFRASVHGSMASTAVTGGANFIGQW